MYFPKEWLLQNVFDFSKDDAVFTDQNHEKERKARESTAMQVGLMKDFPEPLVLVLFQSPVAESVSLNISDVLGRLDEWSNATMSLF